MAGTNLVKTTFQTGPKDELAAVDVYGKGDSGIVNSYQEKDDEAIDVLDSLNGSGKSNNSGEDNPFANPLEELGDAGSDFPGLDGFDSPLDDITKDFSSAQDLTSDELIDRLTNEDSELAATLRDLDAAVEEKIKLDALNADRVYGTFADKTIKIPNSLPISNTRNVSSIINNITKGNYPSVIRDVGATTGLVGSIINIAGALRLPQAFSKIAQYSGLSPDILVNAARIGINSSLARGDLSVFKDVASTSIASQIKYAIPNVINRAIGQAQRPYDLQQQQYPTYYREARDSFSAVDPNWNYTQRGNRNIYNGNAVGSNPFFLNTLRSSVVQQPLVVRPAPSTSLNSVMDVEYADLTDPAVFNSLYGTNQSSAERSRIIREWQSNTDATRIRNQRQEDSYMLLMEQYQIDSVHDSLKTDFPFIQAEVDRSIYLPEVYDGNNITYEA